MNNKDLAEKELGQVRRSLEELDEKRRVLIKRVGILEMILAHIHNMKKNKLIIEVETTTDEENSTYHNSITRILVNGEQIGAVQNLTFEADAGDAPRCDVVLPRVDSITVDHPDHDTLLKASRELNTRTTRIEALLKPFPWLKVRYKFIHAADAVNQK